MQLIKVGSKNAIKVSAVKKTIELYPQLFPEVEVIASHIDYPEFGHPIGMAEITAGATARARKAFTDCDYSIGLESGLIEVKSALSGYVEISACVILNAQNSYLGFSTAFEWPLAVIKFILDGKGDASLAFKELGLSSSEKKGAEQGGIVGLLTDMRITREEQIKQSLIMALIYLEKPEMR